MNELAQKMISGNAEERRNFIKALTQLRLNTPELYQEPVESARGKRCAALPSRRKNLLRRKSRTEGTGDRHSRLSGYFY